MAQSEAEKRAYTRGYQRAVARRSAFAIRLVAIAKAYRLRLQDQDSKRVCMSCRRWKRGTKTTLWGECRADFDGPEPRMWVDWPSSSARPAIVTHENFGCVNWLPRTTLTSCFGAEP